MLQTSQPVDVTGNRLYASTRPNARLPRDSGQQPSVEAKQLSGDCQVLVVHHRERMLNLVAEIFTRLGFQVTKTSDSASALYCFGRTRSHLLFADLEMPGLDGYRLARLIKNHTPSTKAVVMTSYCQAELAETMADGIVDGWLFKPFKLRALIETLTEIGMTPGAKPSSKSAPSMDRY